MEEYSPYFILFSFLVGLCFGSFLNVLIYRLPAMKSVVFPSSSCPSCETKLGLVELIPVFGYLILRGRCRHCKNEISLRYPLVELAVGVLFAFSFYYFGYTVNAFFYLVLLYLLLAIALIDLKHRIVPNKLVFAGLIAGLIFYLPALGNLLIDLPSWLIVERDLLDAAGGFLVGGAIMLVIILVSRGGMGAGDMKLMAMIGLFVGLRGTAVVMLLGFFLGAVVGVSLMVLGILTRKDAIPFAPYLSLAAIIQVLWGESIWNWYINLLN